MVIGFRRGVLRRRSVLAVRFVRQIRLPPRRERRPRPVIKPAETIRSHVPAIIGRNNCQIASAERDLTAQSRYSERPQIPRPILGLDQGEKRELVRPFRDADTALP